MKQLTTLIDSNVVDEGGDHVGAVEELILDGRTGRVVHVVVKCPNRTRFCIRWSQVRVEEDRFVVRSNVGS